MKRAIRTGVFLLLFCSIFWITRNVIYPEIIVKKVESGNDTLQMDENKMYPLSDHTISILEGAVILDKGQENQRTLVYTDFLYPNMTVFENFLAFFENSATHFFLVDLSANRVEKIETNAPISAIKLSSRGHALVVSHSSSIVYLFSSSGTLNLTIETELLLCDASVSPNGKRVGIVLFSDKTPNGYIVETFRAKNGQRISSDNLTYEEIPLCYMSKHRLFLKKDDKVIGFLGIGKFHLFP